MSNFDDLRRINNSISQLKSVMCDLLNLQSGGNDVPTETTEGGNANGTIQDSITPSITTGALTQEDDIKVVVIVQDVNSKIQIDITLHDGSSFSHISYGGVYALDLENYQSPVSTVTVTELDDVSTRVSINYLSK